MKKNRTSKNSILSKYSYLVLAAILMVSFSGQAQDSNIRTYTPSKLLSKGQWDVKFFNNLYTETEGTFNGVKADKARENYFTSSLEIFTGVSNNNRINVGLLLEYRSNTVGGRKAISVFDLGNDATARKGLSSFAPAIKWQPIESVGNFSVQSAIHIPLVKNESENGVFLDQTAYTFQNRFFFDHTFGGGDWQIFTELNTEYNFGDDDSFANKTFSLVPGVFMSYFPSNKSTILGFVQHAQRYGDFTQDYTALGFGGKYQITKSLNLEALYSKFVRGENTGLGQSFNIGIRFLSN